MFMQQEIKNFYQKEKKFKIENSIVINFGKCGIWRCCTNYRRLLFDR